MMSNSVLLLEHCTAHYSLMVNCRPLQVLANCDELFDREEFSAAPDPGWPDCFNSGVFVYVPSLETYKNLVEFAKSKGSFDGKIRRRVQSEVV